MTFVGGFELQRAGFRSDFSSTARGSSLEQQEVVEASTCSCQRHHQHQRNYGKTSSSDSKYSRNCKFSSQLRKHSPWYLRSTTAYATVHTAGSHVSATGSTPAGHSLSPKTAASVVQHHHSSVYAYFGICTGAEYSD